MSCGSSAVFTYTRKLCEKLTKIFRFRENIPFRMWIWIQEPTECASRSETLLMIPKNHLKNFVFGGRLQEHKNICKNFCKNKNFHENEHFRKNFRKSKNFWRKTKIIRSLCNYGSATLLSDIVISSVAEPHHYYAALAPGKNFYAAPAPARTLQISNAKFLKLT
jgi:hypothetical protein